MKKITKCVYSGLNLLKIFVMEAEIFEKSAFSVAIYTNAISISASRLSSGLLRRYASRMRLRIVTRSTA